ncbi:MAG TPA: hypothetical protein DCR44_06720 [Acholeplasmatales bacterium]|nr:hypothetical protein [Acholeplasmatales bacterium]
MAAIPVNSKSTENLPRTCPLCPATSRRSRW